MRFDSASRPQQKHACTFFYESTFLPGRLGRWAPNRLFWAWNFERVRWHFTVRAPLNKEKVREVRVRTPTEGTHSHDLKFIQPSFLRAADYLCIAVMCETRIVFLGNNRSCKRAEDEWDPHCINELIELRKWSKPQRGKTLLLRENFNKIIYLKTLRVGAIKILPWTSTHRKCFYFNWKWTTGPRKLAPFAPCRFFASHNLSAVLGGGQFYYNFIKISPAAGV